MSLDKIIEKILLKGKRLTLDAKKLLESLNSEPNLYEILERIIKEKEGLFIEKEDIQKFMAESSSTELTEQITPSAKHFKPEAKGITSKVKILHNPGLNSHLIEEEKEDLVSLFQNRYEKVTKLLSKKLGLRKISGVKPAINLKNKDTTLITGIISNKRIRLKGLWLDLEDTNSKVSIFVSSKNQVNFSIARSAPLDSVIAAKIRRINEKLIITEQLYYPDIENSKQGRSKEEVYAVLSSDLHIGSKTFEKNLFNKFCLWINGKYGTEADREIASKTKYLVIAGDIVDGVGIYPKQKRELEEISVRRQYILASHLLEQIPEYVDIIILPGNHDATRRALPQPPILKEYAEEFYNRNYYMVGNPVNIDLHGVNIYSFHGRSLDDCISIIPGINSNNISVAMEILLKSRHIAPTYGLNTRILPQKTDELVIPYSPDIFHAGHIHINDYSKYRKTLIINSGTWQSKTEFQKEIGLTPKIGEVPIVNLATFELKVKKFI
jgi:DNA polymerase II small subunit